MYIQKERFWKDKHETVTLYFWQVSIEIGARGWAGNFYFILHSSG